MLSAQPAAITAAAGSARSGRPEGAINSAAECAAATRPSCAWTERRAAASRHDLSMITAQLHTEAASSSSSTPLTTMSA